MFWSRRASPSLTEKRLFFALFPRPSQTEVRGCCVFPSKLKLSSGMAHANCSRECVKFIEGCHCKAVCTQQSRPVWRLHYRGVTETIFAAVARARLEIKRVTLQAATRCIDMPFKNVLLCFMFSLPKKQNK